MTINFVLISGMLGFLRLIFFVFIKKRWGFVVEREGDSDLEFKFEISSNIGKINITR